MTAQALAAAGSASVEPAEVTVFAPWYRPIVGGSQMVARELAVRISDRYRVVVLRLHGDEATNQTPPWSLLARSRDQLVWDEGVPVASLAPARLVRPLLSAVGSACERVRLTRPLFELLLYRALRGPLARRVAGTRLLHVYGNGVPGALWLVHDVARRQGIPLVITPFWHLERSSIAGRLSPRTAILPRICREAAAVVAMTPLERDALVARGVRPERCHVIPGGPVLGAAADARDFRRRHGLGAEPLVLFVGRVCDAKGYRALLAAAPVIWSRFPEARLLFAGPLDAAAAACLARHVDARGRVIALGEVSLQEKSSALAACDVLCVPSSTESLGLVYLEAWAMRKPVVAQRIPVLETVIEDGVDGLLVGDGVAGVSEAILALLADPLRARAMGEAGAAKVARRYDWSRAADALARLYADLIRGRRAVSASATRDAAAVAAG